MAISNKLVILVERKVQVDLFLPFIFGRFFGLDVAHTDLACAHRASLALHFHSLFWRLRSCSWLLLSWFLRLGDTSISDGSLTAWLEKVVNVIFDENWVLLFFNIAGSQLRHRCRPSLLLYSKSLRVRWFSWVNCLAFFFRNRDCEAFKCRLLFSLNRGMCASKSLALLHNHFFHGRWLIQLGQYVI